MQSISILLIAVASQYIWIQRTKILTSSPQIRTYRSKHISIRDPRNVAAICTENMLSAWSTRLQSFWWCFLVRSKQSLVMLFLSSRICLVLWLNSHARLFVTVNRRADGAIHAKTKYTCTTRLIIFTARTSISWSFRIIGYRRWSCIWEPNMRYPLNAVFKMANTHITPVQISVCFFRDAVLCAHSDRNSSHANKNSGKRL